MFRLVLSLFLAPFLPLNLGNSPLLPAFEVIKSAKNIPKTIAK